MLVRWRLPLGNLFLPSQAALFMKANPPALLGGLPNFDSAGSPIPRRFTLASLKPSASEQSKLGCAEVNIEHGASIRAMRQKKAKSF